MIDLTDPPWLVAIAFFLFLIVLMVWFPIHYWRKDRQRRKQAGGQK